MRVRVVGAGLMGAQIGCEYALGGHDVTLTARHPDRVEERVDNALATAEDLSLFTPEQVAEARARLTVAGEYAPDGWELVVESVPEDFELKATVLRPLAAASPEAALATNTSSLSIAKLGEAVAAPERTIGTHYWNPPLLMPPVEVVAGERTSSDVVALV